MKLWLMGALREELAQADFSFLMAKKTSECSMKKSQVPKFQAVDEYTLTSLSIAGEDLLFATHCPSLSSHPAEGYHFSDLLAELHI